uniref:Uncharacterized protein n=1 Tax=Trichinella nativa TaxID=6335 RepID=A0A0V1KGW0_9BILA
MSPYYMLEYLLSISPEELTIPTGMEESYSFPTSFPTSADT